MTTEEKRIREAIARKCNHFQVSKEQLIALWRDALKNQKADLERKTRYARYVEDDHEAFCEWVATRGISAKRLGMTMRKHGIPGAIGF